ncbi:NifU family protein [Actinoallomurus spadix]|uniref:NIF system FeS cluster assembly NifU C-terminal domain-containing protein n=1 Tax=Actinoallomurus spadix TaxID=79912 RepID=A0ABN0X472_9ACTN|nr:NifU family protein [Actinoallomurus spadix]MCO5986751.1 NifU family protein [Actinoallomurus spadix]
MADRPADRPAAGLPEEEVQDRLMRLDVLLERLERATGDDAETARHAVEALTEVYGTALARLMALVGGVPELSTAPARDELLHHLLVLHGLHPQPVEERVARALDDVREALRPRGETVELTGIADGVARLRWSGGGGCASSAASVERALAESVLTMAPELRRVEVSPAPAARPAPAVIPVESLLRRPAASARPGSRTP